MIVCPNCRNSLEMATGSIQCRGCGKSYAAPFGVPILVKDATLERVTPPSDQFVRDMSAALNAPEEQVRECFSLRVKMPNPGMQVEADQFVSRMRSSGFVIDGQNTVEGISRWPVNIPDQVQVRLQAIIWPKIFEVSRQYSVNIRVSNNGTCGLSSKTAPPLFLAYHWYGEDGVVEGHRTQLLIDLPPHRSITMPVFFTTPARAGTYTLEVAPLLETVTWFKEFAVSTSCEVVDHVPALPWFHDLSIPQRGYSADHKHGIAMLERLIEEHFPDREPDILEIGGNSSPMTSALPRGNRWNVDVDAHGLMVLNMGGGGGIKSIVGDGCDLPFANGSLDMATMFATFHHFPDPVGLLQHLAKKVKSNGLVCLMCEPIGHVTAQHDYKEYFHELNAGVNEQSFEIWEYVAMLEASGLEIVEASFEQGSAKIAARPIT